MMKKVTKLTKIIFLLFTLILIIPHECVDARTSFGASGDFGGGTVSYYDPENPNPEPSDPPLHPLGDYDGHDLFCTYTTDSGTERRIDINAYDLEGNSVIPYSKKTSLKFNAGTRVGINLREYRSAWWTSEVTGLKERKECVDVIQTWDNPACMENACGPNWMNCSTSEEYLKKLNECAWASYGCENSSYERCFTLGEINAGIKQDFIESQSSSYGYCHKLVTAKPDKYVGASNTAASNDCGVLAAADAMGSVVASLEPTLEFEILDPNEYDPNKKIKFVDDPDNGYYVAQLWLGKNCNNKQKNEKQVDVLVSCDGGKRTNKPAAGANLAQGLDSSNWKNYASGSYHATYEYTPPKDADGNSKTCINVKTGNVCYDCEKDPICNSDPDNNKMVEFGETKDSSLNTGSYKDEPVEFWYYFIPFNTPTNEAYSDDQSDDQKDQKKFFIRVGTKREKLTSDEIGSPGECASMVKNYPKHRNGDDDSEDEYPEIIVPIKFYENNTIETGEIREFKGDYYGDRNLLSSSEDYRLFTQEGYRCIFSIRQEFNIEQDFYEENEDRTKLNGYGFYYRPINPNEPFPNGLEIDSFWYDLYQDDNKVKVSAKNNIEEEDVVTTIDLDKSFAEVTYSTRNISRKEIIKEIQNEGDESNYTSWDNITSEDGKSQFVSNLYLRENVQSKCIYPLGCGPNNIKRIDDISDNWCPKYEDIKGCGD